MSVQPKPRPFLLDLLRRLVGERPLGAASAVVILLLALIAILADVLAPFPFAEMHLVDRLGDPSATYLLGTDQLGRDVLSRLVYGARTSLGVGFAATVLSTLVALLVGGVAGFVGGKLDILVQRFVDAWMSFPGLLLLLTIITIVGQGILQIIVVLGVTSGIGNSRVIRSAVIGIKENPYFESARAIGGTAWHTLRRHVWPNITAPVIVVFSITIGGIIIAEASLSFLGFGLPTTVPSWGGMLSREGRQFMEMAPRLAMWPGVALTVVVYCPQHVRRRGARPARSSPAGRRRRRRPRHRRHERPRHRRRPPCPAKSRPLHLTTYAPVTVVCPGEVSRAGRAIAGARPGNPPHPCSQASPSAAPPRTPRQTPP